MKCFIIAAVSADGFIARNENEASFLWTSAEDKKRFIELTKKAGVIVAGSSTFATFKKPLKDRVNIVYSRSKTFEGAETTEDSPAALLKKLEMRGFSEVAICGGAQIYSLFMKAGVVTSIFLTIEPVVFGSGIKLFSEEIRARLRLVTTEKTEKGTLLLEYAVDN